MRKHVSGLMLDIGAYDQDLQSISKDLRELQNSTSPSEDLVFLIWPDAPIEQMMDTIVETIRVCSQKNHRFRRFIFHHYDFGNQAHLAVLQAACRFPLFELVVVRSTAGSPVQESTLHTLKYGMIANKSLKGITLDHLEMAEDGFGILGDGLKATESLESLSIGCWLQAPEDDITLPPVFFQGLKENRSLKSLGLQSLPTSIEASLEALLDHPTIKTLSLTNSRWTESSMDALESLLSSPRCRITSLNLSEPRNDTRNVFIAKLGHVIKNNQSVRWLGLGRCRFEETTLAKLWPEIASMKQLVNIDLEVNQIQSLAFTKSKVAPGLKVLGIQHNPILKLKPNDAEANGGILECLQAQPNLHSFGKDFAESAACTPKIQHFMDMNGNGGLRLFGNHDALPLWPKVLERGNKKLAGHHMRQASVAYKLLRDISASLM